MDIIAVPAQLPQHTRVPAVSELLASFLTRRSERTRRAYAADLRALTAHLGLEDSKETAKRLVSLNGPQANLLALEWRQGMLESGLAPSTINRRLSTIRSLTRMFRTVGLISWSLEVEGEKRQPVRDTRGPGVTGVEALLHAAASQRCETKAARDVTIIRLLFDLGLRRMEVLGLDLEHVDLTQGQVNILGKGRVNRIALTLPAQTQQALSTWVEMRGDHDGPLFSALDTARHSRASGKRLSGEAVRWLLGQLSKLAGIDRVRPHGLRHAAITCALDATGGDLRSVQRFSRHADVRMLRTYDDNRQDLGGKVACKVAGLVG